MSIPKAYIANFGHRYKRNLEVHMEFYDKTAEKTVKALNTSINYGLTAKEANLRLKKYGENSLSRQKKKGFFSKVIDALKEPMLLILAFGFILSLGSCLGEFFKTKHADFSECVGILIAILLSVSITLFMEGSSEKAFLTLNRVYGDLTVKVVRDGTVIVVSQRNLVVGDIVILETGDKIVADGRLIYSENLRVDESMLTGESKEVSKNSEIVCPNFAPLAERQNSVFSGSFITEGRGKMVVTKTGDNTELGAIAKGLKGEEQIESPLKKKLGLLGRTISIIGTIISTLVFVASFIRLSALGNLNFNSIRELFLSCVVLIIAIVPEGLPTIVAVSLALNMIKLAGENALIKKMTATETAGAVSVICSDKTGTLTQNKMTVEKIFSQTKSYKPQELANKMLILNFACNTTANLSKDNKVIGSSTEGALLKALTLSKNALDYNDLRRLYPVQKRTPFSSKIKYMSTTIKTSDGLVELVKGAPEVIFSLIKQGEISKSVFEALDNEKKNAKRVLCFAHKDVKDGEHSEYIFDGFVSISDPIRKEAKKAVMDCKKAGIKVKILTGDSKETAFQIAKELGVATSIEEVALSKDLENLSLSALVKTLEKITVVARSTPSIKLKIVEALKKSGEVVAVTGDGVNDAPAIKRADVGIAMGKSGSEITKEASDIVLLDDSFSSVVSAIAFGRNVYLNIKKFITFQLSVNFSALIFVTVCVIAGYPSPFSTLSLLWINLIMDGPPALTLGLSKNDYNLMEKSPVKKNESIVSKVMLLKIIYSAVFIGAIMLLQQFTNFLGAGDSEKKSAIFTLFVFLQLFNAFNAQELSSKSVFSSIGKNKIMLITFSSVFLLHLIMVRRLYGAFGFSKIRYLIIIKAFLVALCVVLVSEIIKLIYRKTKKTSQN